MKSIWNLAIAETNKIVNTPEQSVEMVRIQYHEDEQRIKYLNADWGSDLMISAVRVIRQEQSESTNAIEISRKQ